MCTKIAVTLQAKPGAKKCGAISFTGWSLGVRLAHSRNRFGVVDLVGVETTFVAFTVDLRLIREYELWVPSWGPKPHLYRGEEDRGEPGDRYKWHVNGAKRVL